MGGNDWAAADRNNLPAVSYLKAPAFQDGPQHDVRPLFLNPIKGTVAERR